MSLKYSDFYLQPLKNHKFKLVEEVWFKDIVIPKGFRTDGASVPRLFWFIFPPNRTDYLPCAIIHDYLCDKGEYRKADEYFKECLKELKVNKLTRTIMYLVVRIYHLIKYKQ